MLGIGFYVLKGRWEVVFGGCAEMEGCLFVKYHKNTVVFLCIGNIFYKI